MRGDVLRRTPQIMEFAMKKLILVMALGLSLGSASAFAYEYGQDNRTAYVLSLGLIPTDS
jgi:uncharacterized ferredoxin-like protein